MLDEKDDSGLTEEEKLRIQSLNKEMARMNEQEEKNDYYTDGEMHSYMRLVHQERTIIEYAKDRKILLDRNCSFEEIPGGFIIQSPKMAGRRFYYYPGSRKWRQEGKSQYYRCKNTNDLLDRFILDTSFKGKK